MRSRRDRRHVGARQQGAETHINTLEGEEFEILHAFSWEDYRLHAVAYYEALYEFNLSENQLPVGEWARPETKEEAR
jgi:hypothetical protein